MYKIVLSTLANDLINHIPVYLLVSANCTDMITYWIRNGKEKTHSIYSAYENKLLEERHKVRSYCFQLGLVGSSLLCWGP